MTVIASAPVKRMGSSGTCMLQATWSWSSNVSTCTGTIVVLYSILELVRP
jgi:hypothetical protein